ncbi:MAG: phosphotransferase [Chloroflexota bacterium]|nr:phosphotransferase [Chloroflexota bacterium]
MRLDPKRGVGAAAIFRPRSSVPLWRPDRLARRALARGRTVYPSREAVIAILERYGLPRTTRIRPPPSPGGRSTTLVLEGHDGRLLLKRYRARVELDAIRGEHSILAELARCGVAAPRLHPTLDGGTWVELDGASYAMFEYLEGYIHPHERFFLPVDRRALEMVAGDVLAGFHAALDGFEPAANNENGFAGRSGVRVRNRAWFMERLETATARGTGNGAVAGLVDSASWIRDALCRLDDRLEAAEPTRTVIHGDYGPYNLLVRAGEPVVVIDLELSRVDWQLTDIATAIPRFAQRRLGFDAAAASRFLAGYRRRRELPRGELTLLPDVLAFLSLRRAIVCGALYRETPADRWRAEATIRVRLARSILEGQHPIVDLRNA